MPQSSLKSPGHFDTICIVGVGLIGGSLAAAVKQRQLAARIIGVGRNLPRLQSAQQAGLIDDCLVDLSAAAAESDLIVFCTPVDKIVTGVREAAAHCRPGTLMTDGGSTKGAICAAVSGSLPADVHFVGAHPLAGSEKQGFEHANADLYQDRICVVTPHNDSDPTAVSQVSAFWRQVGMTVIEMSPEEHDNILAETSHVPHLVASALAATLRDETRPLTSSGFRDTTRIAAGDEHLWAAIFQGNKTAMLAGLDQFETQLRELRGAIERDDTETLVQSLRAARVKRETLE
ncbi:prephenate dehydrogenase [Symmachiella dynata]|uniref:Prephenate dehydrogenase n=1 Tax=Symmachiella dynata TaxID=2527995 RepID=A0A517ZH63_9PLAN|nr:prephenate dehydrogenase [Symmachiella dynata]QDU41801.1 prephenate dehydrogenase [Symmachiella dynata]